MTAAGKRDLVFAVHPTAKGFGWALFESPLAPYDWGIVYARKGRNEHVLRRYERLLERHAPSVVVIEEFERAVRGERIRYLCRAMVHLASTRGCDTASYERAAIRTCFASIGATTRYGIAQAIAQHIPAFSHRLPEKRKLWVGDDERQSLFDAVALAITHLAVHGQERPPLF
jgi:Holliday junction resolvasome RuvABC endonuclease subunit